MRLRGFTLIELLIVVAIIGILAAIAVPNFLNARMRSLEARARTDQKAVAHALEMYQIDHGAFPPDHMQAEGFPWRVYHYLTTPVAYISGEVEDPFAVKGVEDFQRGAKDRPIMPVYNYRRIHISIHTHSQTGNPGDKSVAYGVYSYGPDGVWDNFSIIYDMSNGLRSRGDLCRFGGELGGYNMRFRDGP